MYRRGERRARWSGVRWRRVAGVQVDWVGEGANEGEGPGTGTRGWKATEGRQGTRKATIDPWSPSVLPILFLPSTLSSSAGPLCLSSSVPPPPLSYTRVTTSRIHCVHFCSSFFSRQPLALRSARLLLA